MAARGSANAVLIVHVMPEDTLYTHVKGADADEIVQAVRNGKTVDRLLGESRGRRDDPFFRGQQLKVLSCCGRIDPESLDDYLSQGGFQGLARALSGLGPDQIVEFVEKSGLRGRGGAGFPTARKWKSALAAARPNRESARMCSAMATRAIPGPLWIVRVMEGAPFQVLERNDPGSLCTLGATQGYIYVRHEYPLAVSRLERAIEVCRQAGLLGERILGTDLSFDIRISRGGGAFVCGESTALMRSLEGKVGEPLGQVRSLGGARLARLPHGAE